MLSCDSGTKLQTPGGLLSHLTPPLESHGAVQARRQIPNVDESLGDTDGVSLDPRNVDVSADVKNYLAAYWQAQADAYDRECVGARKYLPE